MMGIMRNEIIKLAKSKSANFKWKDDFPKAEKGQSMAQNSHRTELILKKGFLV